MPHFRQAQRGRVDGRELEALPPDPERGFDFLSGEHFDAEPQLDERGTTIILELLIIEEVRDYKIMRERKGRRPKLRAL
jgi:hypothetical protein